jgi:hypothetical protein
MKELRDKPTINDLTPLKPRPIRVRNQVPLAKRQQISSLIKNENGMTESYFKMVVLLVKQLYAPLRQMAFERDYRQCANEYASAMHTFANANIYLHLECGFDMSYLFRYDFNDCPFEAEITARIAYLFSMNPQSKRVTLTPESFKFFSGATATAEDRPYLSILQAD